MKVADALAEAAQRKAGERQPAIEAGKRLTVNLSPESVAALDKINACGSKSYADIIRDAIWLEEQVCTLIRSGGELVFKSPEGELQRVILR